MTERLAIEVIPGVGSIGPDEWSRLDGGGNLYLSYPWLRCADADVRYRPQHLVARRRDGSLLAAAPAYVWSGRDGNTLVDPYFQLVEPALAGPGDRGAWFPTLLVGGLGSKGGFLYSDGLDGAERAAATRALLDGLDALGRRSGCASVALMYLDRAATTELRAVLTAAGREVPVLVSLPDVALPIRWESFQDYVDGLRANRRRSVLNELARFQRSGCEVSSGSLRQWWEAILPLLELTRASRAQPDPGLEMRERLSREAEALDPLSRVFVCHRDGRLLAASLTYQWEGVLYVRDWGFDHDRARPAFEYFVMHFYAPMRHAIERALSAVNFGPIAYQAKLRRGAQPEPRFSVFLSAPQTLDSWRTGKWNQAMTTAYQLDYGQYLGHGAAAVDLAL